MSAPPTVICLTPVKNEAWIIGPFLECASRWADVIVVADQGSQDETVAIASKFDKVRLVTNPDESYDEGSRQQLLLDTAREYPGRRVLVALDADEVLLPAFDSEEWHAALESPEGTVLTFPWWAVGPGMRTTWVDKEAVPFGFVDDGAPLVRGRIHNPRVPTPDGAAKIHVGGCPVLHLQYVNWPRMMSKQRWYQAWETVHLPGKRPAVLYRQYHHMVTARRGARPFDASVLAPYGNVAWDELDRPPERTHHDDGLDRLVREHGPAAFRKVDIWDRTLPPDLHDPRRRADRAALRLLGATQPFAGGTAVRLLDRALGLAGW